jgi:hypothetical protein
MSRTRIDLIGPEESVEAKSAFLFDQLKAGQISVADLMGPLYGETGLMAEANIPPGKKEYFPAAEHADFTPDDNYNTELKSCVHPSDYSNPMPEGEYDLVAIGAGVAGLISCIMGAWLGKKCALIERHAMGGDCLNVGCVPSKAVIACARAVHTAKHLADFGVHIPEGDIKVDFGFVMQRMRQIRAKISHHDSVQRYARDFCKDVFVGHGTFLSSSCKETDCMIKKL